MVVFHEHEHAAVASVKGAHQMGREGRSNNKQPEKHCSTNRKKEVPGRRYVELVLTLCRPAQFGRWRSVLSVLAGRSGDAKILLADEVEGWDIRVRALGGVAENIVDCPLTT